MKKYQAYTLHGGVLYYGIEVCILNFEDFRVIIFYDCHNIPIASHHGLQKTYMVAKKNYF